MDVGVTESLPDALLRFANADVLGRRAVRAYLAALESAEPPRDQCPAANNAGQEWVVLELGDGHGSVYRRDVELAAPWAVDGIPAVVHGPTGGKGAMIDSFIGPLG
jgi:hypothetical protein